MWIEEHWHPYTHTVIDIFWVTLVKVLLAILFDGPFLNNHCNVNFEQVVSNMQQAV